MPTRTEHTKPSIDELVEKMRHGKRLRQNLPHHGKINVEKSLPYLLVYRYQKRGKDPGTARLVLSESSYLIIGDKDLDWYRELLYKTANTLSAVHQSYLILEMWAGETGSRSFKIKAPADRIPSTVKQLQEGIAEMDKFYNRLDIHCETDDTMDRQPPNHARLLDTDELKSAGCLLMGLEIPPVYRSEENQLYPIFFRSFHHRLLEVLHRAFYDFIRVQTSCPIQNYTALGRSTIDDAARETDRKLCAIEQMYSFLWLVSPSNIREIKHHFFESKFEEVLDYHYRLLPLDPDLVKRELYNLPIEAVDDPSLAFLFRDKREELERQISMLNERGTRDFFYNSIRLYKGVEKPLLNHARQIMEKVPEEVDSENSEATISAEDFAHLAEREFDLYREQDPDFRCKIHLRKDVNVMMVSQGQLYVPAQYRMTATEARALIQHEVGTHALTFYNGSKQELRQLAYGLADYDALQEGLAVLSEYLVGGLTANRLRTLAARVFAGSALLDGAGFIEIFRLLHRQYGMGAERSFNVTSRIMQGGGFLKDIIYLQGLVELVEYLQKGGELKPLLLGKIAVKHIDLMKVLSDRKLLKAPTILPSYLGTPETQKRLQKVRDGLPLYEMINK